MDNTGDLTGPIAIGAAVNSFIDGVDGWHPLSGAFKAWLAPILSAIVFVIIYAVDAWTNGKPLLVVPMMLQAGTAYATSQGAYVVKKSKDASRQADAQAGTEANGTTSGGAD